MKRMQEEPEAKICLARARVIKRRVVASSEPIIFPRARTRALKYEQRGRKCSQPAKIVKNSKNHKYTCFIIPEDIFLQYNVKL